jgi:hypothetical protein
LIVSHSKPSGRSPVSSISENCLMMPTFRTIRLQKLHGGSLAPVIMHRFLFQFGDLCLQPIHLFQCPG